MNNNIYIEEKKKYVLSDNYWRFLGICFVKKEINCSIFFNGRDREGLCFK